MLRQYGRLGIITATIAFFLIVLSINLIQTGKDGNRTVPSVPLQEEDPPATEKPYHGFREPSESKQPESDSQVTTTLALSAQANPQTTQTTLSGNAIALQQSPTTTTAAEAPDDTSPSKIIVMGKMSSEDTDWVGQEMTEWQNAIYYVDLSPGVESPSGLKTKMNKAKEVTPYLTYIVDHYPDFPDVMAFIHAHRKGMPQAWHNDAPNYDAVNMLNALRLDTIMNRGYVNMRCNNEIGCPDEVQPWRTPRDDEKHAEHAFPYIYAHFFNASFADMKEQIPVVATQCCAQFAVSKTEVLKRPKSEYERYLRFIEETHYDDDTAGRVLEYMWHIIFGRDAVQCEDVFDCWCNVYGRCRHTGTGGRFGGAVVHVGV